MDSALEATLRTRSIDWVRERAAANGGFLRRNVLGSRIDGPRRM